jgi:hypothetical protein
MANTAVSGFTALAAADAAAADLIPVIDVTETGAAKNKSSRLDALLDALLRIADAGDVVMLDATAGKLIVRQRGGTAGADEGQIYHDGARFVIDSGQGSVDVRGEGTQAVFCVRRVADDALGFYVTAFGIVGIDNKAVIGGGTGVDLFSEPRGVLRLSRTSFGGGAALCSQPRSPAQITSDQNNYAPNTFSNIRLSSDAARSITGLVAGVPGEQIHCIRNVGSHAITLEHQHTSSDEANRFLSITGADIVLAAGEAAAGYYDDTDARWIIWKL